MTDEDLSPQQLGWSRFGKSTWPPMIGLVTFISGLV